MPVGKTFDCVEMKDRIQHDLLREFEARRFEFDTYVDFINATAKDDLEIKAWRERVRLARSAVKSQAPGIPVSRGAQRGSAGRGPGR